MTNEISAKKSKNRVLLSLVFGLLFIYLFFILSLTLFNLSVEILTLASFIIFILFGYFLNREINLYIHRNKTDIDEIESMNADIKELKSLEKELRSSKQLFDSFMQNLPAFITIKHSNGRIIYSNDIAAKYFGRESIVGMSAYELIPKKYAKRIHQMNEKAKKDGYAEDVVEFKGIGNKQNFYRIVTFVIPQDGTKKNYLGTMYFDITKEYKDQYEIAKFNQILENSPISIVITNIKGEIEYVNPRFTQLTGYKLQEAVGKTPKILKTDYRSSEHYEKLWNTISNGDVWTGTFKNKKKNGDVYWESAIIVPTKNRLGDIINYISIKQEITEQMSLKAELADKEEIMISQSRHAAMGEMISMIAHQWRQPISIISMVANNMILDAEFEELSKENYIEHANDIVQQTEYLSKTIDDFRNFFRPNKEKDVVKVEDVIEEANKIIGKSLESHSVELLIKNGNGIEIKTYSRELLQVFINLLKNSKEALVETQSKNRKIDVVIDNTQDYIITTLCDNGGGIDDEHIDKVFEPYFSTKDEKNGTGLGLYMSKTIIEKHMHGTISVKNVGEGVCFKISLPISYNGED